ncbi:hypothetical protein [Aeromonas sp. R9-1]|uniref:hypothetical protein n=1 Tax=Aeromonas sp. R9-1 TaxID=3138478 RepID=UPI0034A4C9D5
MVDLAIKYRNYLLGIYIGGAMLFLLLLETLHNGGFVESIKWLFIPIGIFIFAFFKVNLSKLKKVLWPNSRYKPWLYCVLVYVLTLFMSCPYIIAANAIAANSDVKLVSGVVVNKFISGSKSNSFNVTVKDSSTTKEFDLTVGEEKFKHLKLGDSYSECFYVGRFGILYRWRNTPLTSC